MPKSSFLFCTVLSLPLYFLGCKQAPITSSGDLSSNQEISAMPTLAKEEEKPKSAAVTYKVESVNRGSSAYTTLIKAGLTSAEIYEITTASKKTYNLSRLKAGTKITLGWLESEAKLQSLQIPTSLTDRLSIIREEGAWKVELVELPVNKKTRRFQGVIKDSLWAAGTSAGIPAELIISLAEVFAWQVDFQREVRPGDSFMFSVDEKYADDKLIGFSKITAAEYKSATEHYQAVLFPSNDKYGKYYQPDGSSMRKMFLKSPIKFGRVTSKFNRRRFHPVLKKYRPHNGVDYGAPRGTPVRSVGDGRIVFAKRRGGSGKMVKIRHNSVYQTAYLHLSRYAKGIRSGVKVSQGQIIGYVGSTGLATGPHLHFSFYERGRYVNPLGKKFPSAAPVRKSNMSEFKLVANKALEQLYSHTAQAKVIKNTGL